MTLVEREEFDAVLARLAVRLSDATSLVERSANVDYVSDMQDLLDATRRRIDHVQGNPSAYRNV